MFLDGKLWIPASAAARALGMDRRTLERRADELLIERRTRPGMSCPVYRAADVERALNARPAALAS